MHQRHPAERDDGADSVRAPWPAPAIEAHSIQDYRLLPMLQRIPATGAGRGVRPWTSSRRQGLMLRGRLPPYGCAARERGKSSRTSARCFAQSGEGELPSRRILRVYSKVRRRRNPRRSPGGIEPRSDRNARRESNAPAEGSGRCQFHEGGRQNRVRFNPGSHRSYIGRPASRSELSE